MGMPCTKSSFLETNYSHHRAAFINHHVQPTPSRSLMTSMPPLYATDVQAPTTNRVAADGDYVEVHYTGTLEDGTIFDSSREREPLSFVIGAGTVVPGFDKAVTGLAVGERRTQRVEPADAYGVFLCVNVWVVPWVWDNVHEKWWHVC